MDSNLPPTGKTSLVLGAGSAAGRVIAVALAAAGADVAVASSSLDGDEVMACRRTRRAIEKLGRRSAEYAFDVTLGQNVTVSTRQVAKEMGGLDVLVWAVHSSTIGPTEKVSDAEWSRQLAINLSGAFYACRAALREMLQSRRGRILLVADGRDAAGGEHVALRAAHGGVHGLVAALAEEFGGRGIGVYGIDVVTGVSDAPDVAALAVTLTGDETNATNGAILAAGIGGGA